MSGLRAGWVREPHFRWHLLLAAIALSLAALAAPSKLEWAVLLGACVAVPVVQLLNMVSELTMDVMVSEYHPLVRHAKNAAAGAVLLTALAALLVFAVILGPALPGMWAEFQHLLQQRPAVLLIWAMIIFAIGWATLRPMRRSGG